MYIRSNIENDRKYFDWTKAINKCEKQKQKRNGASEKHCDLQVDKAGLSRSLCNHSYGLKFEHLFFNLGHRWHSRISCQIATVCASKWLCRPFTHHWIDKGKYRKTVVSGRPVASGRKELFVEKISRYEMISGICLIEFE